MAHPQSTNRGFIATQRLDVGASQITSNSTALVLNNGVKVSNAAGGQLTANSTALILPGGVKISNQAKGQLTANSTGVIAPGSIYPSAAAGAGLQANSTSIIVPAVQIGAWSTAITVDTTGILIGSLYISCNSTGNTTT